MLSEFNKKKNDKTQNCFSKISHNLSQVKCYNYYTINYYINKCQKLIN